MQYLANILFIALPVTALGFVMSAFAVIALNDGAYFYSLPMLAFSGLCGGVVSFVFVEQI